MKNVVNDGLRENTLGIILKKILPNTKWIHDKVVPELDNTKPDYRCEELKLIVEFDGYQHYTKSKEIVRDYQKDKMRKQAGYNNIRIPYFVQLTAEVVCNLFEDYDIVLDDYSKGYPHGFISDNVIYPADFCSLGVRRFTKDLQRFGDTVRNDIAKSLANKVNMSEYQLKPIRVLSGYRRFFADDLDGES